MAEYKILRIIVTLDALLMAYGHAPLALFLGALFRSGVPPTGPPPGGFSFFFALGAYFLFATIVYVLGAALIASGRLFKVSNLSLIILAVIDNILLIDTRVDPGNVFFHRVIPWSFDWFPRLGTVQVLIGQFLIIVLCAGLYRAK